MENNVDFVFEDILVEESIYSKDETYLNSKLKKIEKIEDIKIEENSITSANIQKDLYLINKKTETSVAIKINVKLKFNGLSLGYIETNIKTNYILEGVKESLELKKIIENEINSINKQIRKIDKEKIKRLLNVDDGNFEEVKKYCKKTNIIMNVGNDINEDKKMALVNQITKENVHFDYRDINFQKDRVKLISFYEKNGFELINELEKKYLVKEKTVGENEISISFKFPFSNNSNEYYDKMNNKFIELCDLEKILLEYGYYFEIKEKDGSI